jgi:hypothetical protein
MWHVSALLLSSGHKFQECKREITTLCNPEYMYKAFTLFINSVETTDTVQAARNCVKILDPEIRN